MTLKDDFLKRNSSHTLRIIHPNTSRGTLLGAARRVGATGFPKDFSKDFLKDFSLDFSLDFLKDFSKGFLKRTS